MLNLKYFSRKEDSILEWMSSKLDVVWLDENILRWLNLDSDYFIYNIVE